MRWTTLALSLWLAGVPAIHAASPSEAMRILTARCTACHNAAHPSGLDLSTPGGLSKGGGRGAAVVPGDPEASLLYQAVCCDGELQMPPQGARLPAEEVTALRAWIEGGAAWPGSAGGQPAAGWWSLRPVTRPEVPSHGGTWARTEIDQFIARAHAEQGLTAARQADRRSWIRRATYDLHGLPPHPKDVQAFLEDPSPNAFEAVIDRLLDSERYGERWGRYWLDVVRYADTGGFETDIYFPDAWRYRDYVIKSFNDDKPFDRFIKEQVAADQIWPDDIELRGSYDIPEDKQRNREARIGTGLYTIGTVYHEAALNGGQLRYEWMVDAVDVTGEAFLGLTLGCARCHDHKFDPISQREYHELMAFFEGSEIRRIPVVHKMSELGYYSAYPRQLKVFEYQEAIKALESAARKRMIDEIAQGFDEQTVKAYRVPRKKRTTRQLADAAPLERALTEAGLLENPGGYAPALPYTPAERDRRESLIRDLGEAAAKARFELPTATVLGESEVHYPVRLTDRGDWRQTGDRVAARLPAALGPDRAAVAGDRRRALAEWLASPNNPLVARVMVNRIWQGHFGRGLVGTPNNFGRQGDRPTHPGLLDWLASEFVAQGWSVKAMHRLIMLSSTYRMSSAGAAGDARKDPDNRYLWRMNRTRLNAEGLRDAVLAVAGSLNPKMGGRPVLPPLSQEERLGMWNKDAWPESLDPAAHNRRSVYVFAKRQFPYPMFKTFDAPDPAASCGRRAVTTVAPQALTLLNSRFMLDAATSLARRLSAIEAPDQLVQRAWELALARPPDRRELDQATQLLAESGPAELALMLFNLNEFVYID